MKTALLLSLEWVMWNGHRYAWNFVFPQRVTTPYSAAELQIVALFIEFFTVTLGPRN